jgi:eukaryotic-like serine/threonine-protein kinase
MPLALGSHLGPYEITAAIGAGGMGEVYLARDTKLGRDVALKILPDAFSADAERVARFEREARTLATLNHQHIAQIYGVEEQGSTSALVMEFVDGITLAERIGRGAMNLDEVLPVARQIAEALEAAHARDVVHRDLKPANIKLRADGAVKVLDFGLAKALAPASGTSETGSNAAVVTHPPTVTSPALTHIGVILGTAAYMSPEQAKGIPVDSRADIWAFGCVVYEMMTGRPPFRGESVTEVLAKIIEREPDWRQLPAGTPPALRRVLERCLQKNPAKRWRHIGDVILDLDLASAEWAHPAGQSPLRQRRWRESLAWLSAALMAGLAAALWAGVREAAPAKVTAFDVSAPPDHLFGLALAAPYPAVSPDGARE